MKQVLIDFERLKYPHCGLGQVSLNLAKAFGRRADKTPLSLNFLIPREQFGHFGPNVKYTAPTITKRYFPAIGKAYDLWHSLHQAPAYLPSSKKNKWMMTIHDLNFLGEKSPTKARRRLDDLQRKIDRMDHISAISYFTKSEIEKHLDVKGREIDVIYWGMDHLKEDSALESERTVPRPTFVPEGNFLFALGVVRPKKNFHVLVEMLSRLDNYSKKESWEQEPLNLIIAGPQDAIYTQKIVEQVEKFGLSDRVILPGAISHEARQWCFTHCSAFVFPSLFEGFGMPILEAMTFGKPVFSSDKTSLPEVGGDAAYYWNDFHPDSMAEVFEQGMKDFMDHPEKAQEVQKWAAQFTWDNSAKKSRTSIKMSSGCEFRF